MKRKFLPILLLVLVLGACAGIHNQTPVADAQAILKATADVYVTYRGVIESLYASGHISIADYNAAVAIEQQVYDGLQSYGADLIIIESVLYEIQHTTDAAAKKEKLAQVADMERKRDADKAQLDHLLNELSRYTGGSHVGAGQN